LSKIFLFLEIVSFGFINKFLKNVLVLLDNEFKTILKAKRTIINCSLLLIFAAFSLMKVCKIFLE
jgi:hypothetical protein